MYSCQSFPGLRGMGPRTGRLFCWCFKVLGLGLLGRGFWFQLNYKVCGGGIVCSSPGPTALSWAGGLAETTVGPMGLQFSGSPGAACLLSSCSGCLVQLIVKVPAGRAVYPGVQSGRPGRLGLINQSIE